MLASRTNLFKMFKALLPKRSLTVLTSYNFHVQYGLHYVSNAYVKVYDDVADNHKIDLDPSFLRNFKIIILKNIELIFIA